MTDLEEGDQHITKHARIDAGHIPDKDTLIFSPSPQQQSTPLGVNIQTRALAAIREVLQDQGTTSVTLAWLNLFQ